eukprot:CAMPEP_0181326076 /NCGR_PEP_ID=MMETSP1101-20121128/21288_1 /TAXON_ID=46948 /ORGANISM="Rhodomonas abbreviata, Strain Caron Lab Isolate" /LENGTH=211 /DNA_ID=CAMNT_0023434471 /DNA_START=64 /DNA_END=700 /DNA_ORIENTATION=-
MPNTDIAMFHVTDGAPTRLDSAEKNFDTVQEKRLELACEAPGHEDTLPCCAAGENHSFDGLCGESFDASTKDLGCGKLPSGLHCQCGHELSEELNASFIPMSAQRPADVKERVLQHSRSGPGGLAGAGAEEDAALNPLYGRLRVHRSQESGRAQYHQVHLKEDAQLNPLHRRKRGHEHRQQTAGTQAQQQADQKRKDHPEGKDGGKKCEVE